MAFAARNPQAWAPCNELDGIYAALRLLHFPDIALWLPKALGALKHTRIRFHSARLSLRLMANFYCRVFIHSFWS